MTTFLDNVIQDVILRHKTFDNLTFVLPNQRSGVYLKKHLLKKIQSSGFLPQIITFDNLVEKINGLIKTPSIELLFEFYAVYLKVTPKDNQEPFEVFSQWAKMVLDDFNEIDNNLVVPKEIFTELSDINKIQNWNPNTELTGNYLKFMQQLHDLYNAFKLQLTEKGKSYQGMLFREAVEEIEHFVQNTDKIYVFAGFSQLKKAEEVIVQELLNVDKAHVYWDIPEAFFKEKYFQNSFIHQYQNQWLYYQNHEIKWQSPFKFEPENIEVLGLSKKMGMIKFLGSFLKQHPHPEKVTIVLPDPNLLNGVLQSIPNEVVTLNITMGVSVKNFPISSLIQQIFNLHISNTQPEKGYYFKNVVKVLQHPVLLQIDTNIKDVVGEILKKNKVYLSAFEISEHFKNLPENILNPLNILFLNENSINLNRFLENLKSFVVSLKPYFDSINREVLFHHYQFIQKLQRQLEQYPFVTNLKTLFQLYNQLIFADSVNFIGEPLKGTQIMGLLESQTIDIEHLVILSVNEGILPKKQKAQTFIPFDVRKTFHLPTYQEDEINLAYLFNRLISNAQKTTLIYNTDSDTFGGGEKSRYITQLLWKYPNIKHKTLEANIPNYPLQLQKISKTESIISQVKDLFQKGLSPSALGTYIYNPLDFYRQKILKIKEVTDVEETVAENTLGSVVHGVLEDIYTPFIGKYLDAKSLHNYIPKTKQLVFDKFSELYKNGNITEGKNRLIYEVAINFVQRFLKHEIEELNQGHEIKIIGLEKEMSATYQFDSLDFPVRFHGIIDRIDTFDGNLRIIDYKTGKVEPTNLRMFNLKDRLADYKNSKALQVMLYACMLSNEKDWKENELLQAGIISFKNHKKGFIPINFAEGNREIDFEITKNRMDEFLQIVEGLLQEIINPEIDFEEKIH